MDAMDAMDAMVDEVRRVPQINQKDARVLVARIQSGDTQAENELIRRSLRLIMRVAARFKQSGCDDLELIQRGAVAVLRAAKSYDPDGAPWSTYVWHVVASSVCRSKATDRDPCVGATDMIGISNGNGFSDDRGSDRHGRRRSRLRRR